jgi:hypothetical protein
MVGSWVSTVTVIVAVQHGDDEASIEALVATLPVDPDPRTPLPLAREGFYR